MSFRVSTTAVVAACLLTQLRAAPLPDTDRSAIAESLHALPSTTNGSPECRFADILDFWARVERPVELALGAAAVYTVDCNSMGRVPALLALGDRLESWDDEPGSENIHSEQVKGFFGCEHDELHFCLYDRIVQCAAENAGESCATLATAVHGADGLFAEYLEDLLLRESLTRQQLPQFLKNSTVREHVRESLEEELKYELDAGSRARMTALMRNISGDATR